MTKPFALASAHQIGEEETLREMTTTIDMTTIDITTIDVTTIGGVRDVGRCQVGVAQREKRGLWDHAVHFTWRPDAARRDKPLH